MFFIIGLTYIGCPNFLFVRGTKIRCLLLSAHCTWHCEDSVSKEAICEEEISKMRLCSKALKI